MHKYKKIIYLFCLIALMVTMLVVPVSAAFIEMPAGTYVANNKLDFSGLISSSYLFENPFYIIDDGEKYYFEGMRLIQIDDTYRVNYYTNISNSLFETAYTDGEWSMAEYQTIYFDEYFYVSGDFQLFFNKNFHPPAERFNLFTTCYNLIVEYVFDGEGVENGILVDSAQHLTVTILSTIAWIFVLVIPFIVVWWVIKVICTAFGRF